MFISKTDNFIFFHVPKTAGSSIHIFLKDYYGLKGKQRYDPVPPIHHIKAQYVLKYMSEAKNFFKFAFVRNPFDRILSAFSDFTQIRPEYSNKLSKLTSFLGINKYLYEYKCFELEDYNFNSYEELCKKGLKLNKSNKLLRIKKNQSFKDFCINFKKSGWIKDTHFKPQSEILCDENNNLLVDFVGKYENLNDDLNYISNKIGFKIDIGHYRKTNHQSYRNYFDDESKNIIESYFRNDLDLFDYSF